MWRRHRRGVARGVFRWPGDHPGGQTGRDSAATSHLTGPRAGARQIQDLERLQASSQTMVRIREITNSLRNTKTGGICKPPCGVKWDTLISKDQHIILTCLIINLEHVLSNLKPTCLPQTVGAFSDSDQCLA